MLELNEATSVTPVAWKKGMNSKCKDWCPVVDIKYDSYIDGCESQGSVYLVTPSSSETHSGKNGNDKTYIKPGTVVTLSVDCSSLEPDVSSGSDTSGGKDTSDQKNKKRHEQDTKDELDKKTTTTDKTGQPRR